MSEENLDPQSTHLDELLEQISAAVMKHEQSKWEIGDLAMKLVERDGVGSLKRCAYVLDYPYTSLHNCMVTSKAYPESKRLDDLDWSHHFVVRRLDNRMEWLQEAASSGWSISDLKAAAFPPVQQSAKASAPTAGITAALTAALKAGISIEAIRQAVEEFIRQENRSEQAA